MKQKRAKTAPVKIGKPKKGREINFIETNIRKRKK